MPVDATTIISLLISVISLAVAAFVGVRQYVIQRNSNSVSAVFEILKHLQEPDFHDSYDFVVGELKNYDSAKGLVGLPVEVSRKVRSICYFFQHIAMLMLLDLIDERPFTAYFRARTVALWEAAGPFIETERVLNAVTGPEFLTLLEAFAVKAGKTTPEVAESILNDWLAKNSDRWRMRSVVKHDVVRQPLWRLTRVTSRSWINRRPQQ